MSISRQLKPDKNIYASSVDSRNLIVMQNAVKVAVERMMQFSSYVRAASHQLLTCKQTKQLASIDEVTYIAG